MNTVLGPVDVAVLVAFLGSAVAIGLVAGGRARSLDSYLLGDRDLPWWVILGSIVATETSAATVLSVPGESFGPAGMRFLQLPLGYMLGRVAIVRFLLPLYFRGELHTAHEVLRDRFGPLVQRAAAVLFLVTRNVGDGLRLFLAALVFQKLTALPLGWCVGVMGVITIVYTVVGGLRSVAWNDCVQLVIYVLGGVVAVFVIGGRIPGGWEAAAAFARSGDKLRVFDWSFDLSDPYTFWAGLVGGAVLSLGTHGTDHMMVQRYLSARGQREAARALLASGVAVFLQFALFLGIGVLLAAFHQLGGEAPPARADEVFATFIVRHFPANTGLVGLLVAAILAAAMSTIASSLNASASSMIHDVWLPLRAAAGRAEPLPPAAALTLTRGLTVCFGLVQIGVGVAAAAVDATVVSRALTIAGYAGGLLLGVFVLGVATTRVGQVAALAGAACGLATLLTVQFILPGHGLRIAWPWYASIGAGVTIVAGSLAATAFPRERTA